MLDIMYNPEDVGKELMSNRGKKTMIRKYHMTDKEQESGRKKWLEDIKNVSRETIEKAGEHFFNPYRKGVYYYQIYAMFSLGANNWHTLNEIIEEMEVLMSNVYIIRDKVSISRWDRFRGKSSRATAIRCKDFVGRVQENMVFFQRLNKRHPTGYKLHQVRSSVDMKRVSSSDFPKGCYSYRLSTYKEMKEALPVRDYSKFDFGGCEKKYVNYKFVGTIITADDRNKEKVST